MQTVYFNFNELGKLVSKDILSKVQTIITEQTKNIEGLLVAFEKPPEGSTYSTVSYDDFIFPDYDTKGISSSLDIFNKFKKDFAAVDVETIKLDMGAEDRELFAQEISTVSLHEMGHFLGLPHNDEDPISIMYIHPDSQYDFSGFNQKETELLQSNVLGLEIEGHELYGEIYSKDILDIQTEAEFLHSVPLWVFEKPGGSSDQVNLWRSYLENQGIIFDDFALRSFSTIELLEMNENNDFLALLAKSEACDKETDNIIQNNQFELDEPKQPLDSLTDLSTSNDLDFGFINDISDLLDNISDIIG